MFFAAWEPIFPEVSRPSWFLAPGGGTRKTAEDGSPGARVDADFGGFCRYQ